MPGAVPDVAMGVDVRAAQRPVHEASCAGSHRAPIPVLFTSATVETAIAVKAAPR
jgi:hypothetical protein